jgi:calcineurin-like phosphoesterase family protein
MDPSTEEWLMFGFLNAKPATDFAIKLADEYCSRCPVGANQSSQYVTRIVNEICKSAVEFHGHQHMGFFARSRFATEFKLHLKERGYHPALVDELTTKVLIALSKK